MKKIMLEQLLKCCDLVGDPADKIRIVTPKQEWNYADELYVNSELLEPFKKWEITDIRCEESVLKVGIQSPI